MSRKLKNILLTERTVYYKITFTIILACAAIILSYHAGFIFGKVLFQLKTNIF